MKKTISLFLITLLCFTLVGCGSKENEGEKESKEKEEITVSTHVINDANIFGLFQSTYKKEVSIEYTLTFYKDEKELGKYDGTISNFMPGSKRVELVNFWDIRKDYEEFDNCKLEYTIDPEGGFSYLYHDYVKISDVREDKEDTLNALYATVTNTHEKFNIYRIKVTALYFKGDKLVGVESALTTPDLREKDIWSLGLLDAGESRTVSFGRPMKYPDPIEYDRYEILVEEAYDLLETESGR